MATVKPFQPYRYTSKAGDPAHLLTQPYDKINPAMQAKYLAASPYNLVRVILGERNAQDNASDNVYTRAAKHLDDWTRDGILAQDPQAGVLRLLSGLRRAGYRGARDAHGIHRAG